MLRILFHFRKKLLQATRSAKRILLLSEMFLREKRRAGSKAPCSSLFSKKIAREYPSLWDGYSQRNYFSWMEKNASHSFPFSKKIDIIFLQIRNSWYNLCNRYITVPYLNVKMCLLTPTDCGFRELCLVRPFSHYTNKNDT
jgi:hypothetical protein